MTTIDLTKHIDDHAHTTVVRDAITQKRSIQQQTISFYGIPYNPLGTASFGWRATPTGAGKPENKGIPLQLINIIEPFSQSIDSKLLDYDRVHADYQRARSHHEKRKGWIFAKSALLTTSGLTTPLATISALTTNDPIAYLIAAGAGATGTYLLRDLIKTKGKEPEPPPLTNSFEAYKKLHGAAKKADVFLQRTYLPDLLETHPRIGERL